jgi:hypothetical protein
VGPQFPDRAIIDKIDILLFAIPTEGVRYVPVQLETVFVRRLTVKHQDRIWPR